MPLKVMEVFEDNGTSNFVQREYDSSLEDPVQVAEVVDSTLKFQVYTQHVNLQLYLLNPKNLHICSLILSNFIISSSKSPP